MGRLADLLSSGKRPLWIEATAYAERLMSNGAVPWLDVAEVVAWHRKGQGLLKSDVVSLPIARIAEAWRQADSELAEEMSAKKRATVPLKILLASESLRAHIVEILKGLRASYGSNPLALVVPSPRRWVGDAYAAAHGEAPEVGEDEADGAAMYLADFLRTFGESGVDVVLLEESEQTAPANAVEIKWYQSVFNIAAHYRWECGLRIPVQRDIAGAEGLDFCVAPETVAGIPTGVAIASAFWQAGSAPTVAAGGFIFAEIPVDAVPETTLERLALLR
ncbi:MAG: hypothetical protein M0P39_10335 [Rhodocyclaceae bacterium]|nr:hypothetical protein [Rhodocyclaceae bacterium]